MGEKEFIKRYMQARGITKTKEAKEKIDLFWEAMVKALKEEKEVKIKDWGCFQMKEAAPRAIVELRTKEIITIPARTKLKFRPGKGLLATINHENEEMGVDE